MPDVKKPRVFVSPCGTSLFINQVDDALRQLLRNTSNAKAADLTKDQKQNLDRHIQQRKTALLSAPPNWQMLKTLSAELNGLITYYGDKIQPQGIERSDIHYLLRSDTYQGIQASEIVVQWLRDRQLNAESVSISKLSTNNLADFRAGMTELIDWCDRTLRPLQGSHHIVFNLTSGFKSVSGFLQAVGMFYADESIYIFEGSKELLTIPKLPLRLDPESTIGGHLEVFRRLGIGQALAIADCAGIPETLLFQMDEQVMLSEWGNLMWLQAKPQYYAEVLLPPLSAKLQFSPEFKRVAEKLPGDRLRILNERLDDLSGYLDSNGTYNPPSLNFKSLKGKPFTDSTHECYAWSDQDAKRLYGHY